MKKSPFSYAVKLLDRWTIDRLHIIRNFGSIFLLYCKDYLNSQYIFFGRIFNSVLCQDIKQLLNEVE